MKDSTSTKNFVEADDVLLASPLLCVEILKRLKELIFFLCRKIAHGLVSISSRKLTYPVTAHDAVVTGNVAGHRASVFQMARKVFDLHIFASLIFASLFTGHGLICGLSDPSKLTYECTICLYV